MLDRVASPLVPWWLSSSAHPHACLAGPAGGDGLEGGGGRRGGQRRAAGREVRRAAAAAAPGGPAPGEGRPPAYPKPGAPSRQVRVGSWG